MRDEPRSASGGFSKWVRMRVRLLQVLFFGALATIFGSAFNLQVRESDRFKAYAENQYLRELEVPARRGDIYDRSGMPLAQSLDVDSVWVDATAINAAQARALAKAIGIDSRDFAERLGKGRRFNWVKRQVLPEEMARVTALGLPGVGSVKEPRRFYPQRELGAQLIGFVGTDGHGLDGLEKSFEEELSGEAGTRPQFRDARGRSLLTDGLKDSSSQAGASVGLTIDSKLQYVTERALELAVHDAQGIAGTAVVMDPKTGEILALANAPRFNPNRPGTVAPEVFRNRAVTDSFEPGSTFKAFVVAGALEGDTISPATPFDCENGNYAIGSHVIHDTHPHGKLTATQIVQVSSNIGMSKIAQKMGRDNMAKVIERFGFGERTALGLPHEAKGAVPYPRADIALATQSYGQGITTSTVQLAAGYAALANGGLRMRPYVVARVMDGAGAAILENKPTPAEQVVSPETARQVTRMLEAAVGPGGTGERAQIVNYRVAGKTGTAQKADPLARGYSDKRIASFAGYLPAESPRIVIVVVIDEPKTDIYGGIVAAPAFKQIGEAAMAYLGVPSSNGRTRPVATRPPSAAAEEGAVRARADVAASNVVEGGTIRVPDLTATPARSAVKQLLARTLTPQLSGSGWVRSQRPAAGALVPQGSAVRLTLGNLPTLTGGTP